MATSEFCSSISLPFAQPCRSSFHAHDPSIESTEDENKQDCHTFIDHEEYPVYESEEDDDEHGEGESSKILRRFRQKVDEKGHIMCNKLHFKFRRNGTIDRKFRETLHDFKGIVVSDLFQNSSRSDSQASNDHKNSERGMDIGDILSSNQGGMEEPKLERFKVKAVNIAGVGVVKEEK